MVSTRRQGNRWNDKKEEEPAVQAATTIFPSPTTTNEDIVEQTVTKLLEDAQITCTKTKGGWCLKEGLIHVLRVDCSSDTATGAAGTGKLLDIIQKNGLPKMYSIVEDAIASSTRYNCRHDNNDNNNNNNEKTALPPPSPSASLILHKPQTCFQSLCRIIAGQQLAGAAARSMWNRLLQVTQQPMDCKDTTTTTTTTDIVSSCNQSSTLSPETILHLANQGMEDYLQKPAGLSGAKARAIVALAEAFQNGTLSEEFLTKTTTATTTTTNTTTASSTGHGNNNNNNNNTHMHHHHHHEEIRSALLPVKGIGPWTCDIFLLFYLEKANVLPLGDLGVRKGIAKYFGMQGKGKGHKGSLCPVKDKELMEKFMEPYQPYQSIMTYYMWTVADTKDVYLPSPPSTPNKKRGQDQEESAATTGNSTPSRAKRNKSKK